MGTEARLITHVVAALSTVLASAAATAAAVVFSPSVAADPTPAVPTSSDTPPSPPSVLGLLGLPDLSPAYGPNILLGQNAVPSAPGDAISVVAPDLNAFNDQYLLGQNTTPAAPGQGSTAPGLGELDPSSGRLDYLRQLYAMYQGGDLKGALLGQMPQDQLGEPLPGTAPAPGTSIPGLGQNLPEAQLPVTPTGP